MAKSSLSDLNNHLFAALERVNDDLKDDGETKKDADELKLDIERAKAVADIGDTIIRGAKVVLQAMEFQDLTGQEQVPKIFTDKTQKLESK